MSRLVRPELNTTYAQPFVHCITPPFPRSGALTPQVSLNRQDETSSDIPFRYYEDPQLYSISPSSGPALGGTLVDLYGANFSSAMAPIDPNATDHRIGTMPLIVCRFGKPMWPKSYGHLSVLTPSDSISGAHNVGRRHAHPLVPNEVFATVHNDTYAYCISPPSVGGPQDTVEVEISLNGHDFTEGGNTHFQFYSEVPRVYSVRIHTHALSSLNLLQLSLSLSHAHTLPFSLRSFPPPTPPPAAAYSQYAAPASQMDPTSSANSAARLTYLMSGYESSASRGSHSIRSTSPQTSSTTRQSHASHRHYRRIHLS